MVKLGVGMAVPLCSTRCAVAESREVTGVPEGKCIRSRDWEPKLLATPAFSLLNLKSQEMRAEGWSNHD